MRIAVSAEEDRGLESAVSHHFGLRTIFRWEVSFERSRAADQSDKRPAARTGAR